MKALNAVLDDAKLKLADTFVILNCEGFTDQPFYLAEAGNSLITGSLLVKSVAKSPVGNDYSFSSTVLPVSSMTLRKIVPPEGYYNSPSGAYYLKRSTNKQWKISFSGGMYSIGVGSMGSNIVGNSLYPSYPNIAAVEDILKKHPKIESVALNRHVCVRRDSFSNKRFICMHEIDVGTFTKGELYVQDALSRVQLMIKESFL